MKTITTAFNRPAFWKIHSFFGFLVLCLILPNLVSAQFVYNIETTTGTNGSDKSVYILLVGTKGVAEDAFELNGPGDDFRHRAVNKFTYRSDKDLGDITDIALKAHPQDHWQVQKVRVNKIGNKYTSTFTAFRGSGLIKGEWTNLFRANGLEDVSKNISILPEQRIQLPTKYYSISNLDAQNDDTKTEEVTLESTVTDNIELVNTDKNSMNNTLNINISASYASPVGVSVSTDVAYGLEVYNETTKSLTQATSRSSTTNRKPPQLVASPGTIQYVEVKTWEVRVTGKITLLTGETDFYKVVGNDYAYNFYTFDRDNYDEIPEFLIKEKGKPFCLSCNKTKKVVVNDNPVPKPSPVPQPQPVVEKSTTSQVEICDTAGNVIGYFKKNGNGWVETDVDGSTKFRFSETRSDRGVIYLSDKDRQGVKINLDTNNKEVLYSDQNNTTPFQIYIISKTN